MKSQSFSTKTRFFNIVVIITVLASASLACTVPKNVFRAFLGHRDEDEDFMNQYGLEQDDLVGDDISESVLEDNQSYGSADENAPAASPDLAPVPDPVTEECGEGGICVAAYPIDIRGTNNPPDVMVWANAAEYPSPTGFSVTVSGDAGPWYQWMVLREPGQFIQAVSPEGYSALGIQFWGDDTNGWARVTLDGVEVWRGDVTTYGTDGVNYFVYVEITGDVSGPHTLRVEVVGQNGAGGGDNVPVFYFTYRE